MQFHALEAEIKLLQKFWKNVERGLSKFNQDQLRTVQVIIRFHSIH